MAGEISTTTQTKLMRSLGLSTIRSAAKTVGFNKGRTFEERMQYMASRLVFERDDPTMPIVVSAEFKPRPNKNGDGGFYIETNVLIPDPKGGRQDIRVPARPHMLVDGVGGMIPFIKIVTEENGGRKRLVKNTLLCTVFRPDEGDEEKGIIAEKHYRVHPLGLGYDGTYVRKVDGLEREVSGELMLWNKAARTARGSCLPEHQESVNEAWPIIEPITNALLLNERREDLYLTFEPTRLEYVNPEDRGSPITYGDLFGMRVLTESGKPSEDPQAIVGKFDLAIPDKTDVDGNPYFGPQIFVITRITEKAIWVKWQEAGEYRPVKNRVMQFQRYEINGLMALGVDVFTANPTTIFADAMKMAEAPLNDKNPLYADALSREEVQVGQNQMGVRLILRQNARAAAENVQKILDERMEDAEKHFIVAQLPLLEEVLAGNDLAEFWYRTSGEDTVTNLVKAHLGLEQFDWNSWLQRTVRTRVLAIMATRAGKQKPKRPVKEVPKAEEVVPPADVLPPAQEAAAQEKTEADSPAADVPQKKRVRGSKKTNASATPAA